MTTQDATATTRGPTKRLGAEEPAYVMGDQIERLDVATPIVEAPVEPPPDAEVSEADKTPPPEEPAVAYDEELGLPILVADRPPAWAKIPRGFKVAPYVRPIFLRFPPAMTRSPMKGERQCIVWELTDVEEVQAARAGEQSGRLVHEAAKRMIRAIDGHVVDWGVEPGPGSIDTFWREIGPKGRQIAIVVYMRTHQLQTKEMIDFFGSCVAVRSGG